jgi:protein phosphatase
VDNITVVVLDVEAEPGDAEAAGTSARRVERPTKKQLFGVAGKIGLALLVVLVLLIGARLYIDGQWYVGEADGRVAVFRGIPAEFAGFEFSHPVVITEVPAAAAEAISFYASLADGLTANDQQDAITIVDQIRQDVAEAAAPPPDTGSGGGNGGNGNGGGGTGGGGGNGGAST